MKTSTELKRLIKENGLVYWQVANEIGVSESTIVRWLRGTPTPEHSILIESAVASLKGGGCYD